MVEKYDKTPENGEKMESPKGEEELRKLKLLAWRGLGSDKRVEYNVGGQKIRLKTETKKADGRVDEFSISVRKLVPPKSYTKLGSKIAENLPQSLKNWTDYTLKVKYSKLFNEYIFTLKTDDAYGHKDEEVWYGDSFKTSSNKIISNFSERLEEYMEYKKNCQKIKEQRMQELAYNESKEADAGLDKALGDLA